MVRVFLRGVLPLLSFIKGGLLVRSPPLADEGERAGIDITTDKA